MPNRPGKVSFPLAASLPTRLPDGGLAAADVQQIVGNLEGQAQAPAIFVQGGQLRRPGPGGDGPQRNETRIMAPVLRLWIDSSVSSRGC